MPMCAEPTLHIRFDYQFQMRDFKWTKYVHRDEAEVEAI